MAPKILSLSLIGLLVVWFAWSFKIAVEERAEADVSRPFAVYELGDNCVYVLYDSPFYGIAAVPRATAPNYYGRCQ